MVPPSNKPLPEPMLAQIYVTIWFDNELAIHMWLNPSIIMTNQKCPNRVQFNYSVKVASMPCKELFLSARSFDGNKKWESMFIHIVINAVIMPVININIDKNVKVNVHISNVSSYMYKYKWYFIDLIWNTIFDRFILL